MDSEQPPPPPSYEAATAVSPTESPPPFEAAASAPAAVSGLAWHRSQAALSTRYGASGRKDMVSRAEQEREALLRTSGGTRCVVRGLKRTASQEKLDQAVWKTTQDKIRKHQEQQMRNCELEREKRNRELEEREAKRAAWAKERSGRGSGGARKVQRSGLSKRRRSELRRGKESSENGIVQTGR